MFKKIKIAFGFFCRILYVLQCSKYKNTFVLHSSYPIPSVTNGGGAASLRRKGKDISIKLLFIVRGEYRLWALPQEIIKENEEEKNVYSSEEKPLLAASNSDSDTDSDTGIMPVRM